MKKCILTLTIMALASMAFAGQTTTVIFNDSFDRAANNDIDASSTGMSGVASPVTYVESGDADASNEGLTNIENNQLQLADGPNMSVLYIDHNFINSEILAAGGLRIGMTIVSNNATFAENERYCGFGIGNTLDECINNSLDFNNPGFRGRPDNNDGSSDIWVGWSPNSSGKVQVYKNGPTSNGGENYDIEGIELTGNNRLELELFFSDFSAGSEVTAYIMWDSEIIGVESFEWDNTNENYIGINCRQGGTGFTIDDLKIDAIVNNRAQSPYPPVGDRNNIGQGTISLEWDKGLGITVNEHLVYVTQGLDANGDPNMVGPDVIANGVSVADEPDNSMQYEITVDFDQTIYWRVDEVTNSGTIKGETWSFETKRTVPEILTQPVNDADFEGQPASVFVEALSITTPKFKWYRSVDNSSETWDDDTELTGLVDNMDTYSIASLTTSDEGYYYCIITNEDALDLEATETYVVSNPAYITVKRMVLYWDMEDSVFADMSGNGNDAIDESVKADPADPNITKPTLVADVPGNVGSSSAEFIVEENGDYDRLTASLDLDLDEDDTTVEPQRFHEGYTLTFWAKPTTVPQANLTGLFNNEGGSDDFQISFSHLAEGGSVSYHNDTTWQIGPATTEWFQIAIVCDGTSTTAYYNLEGHNRVDMNNVANTLFGVFRVGTNRSTALPYNGLIDDVKIWNYPLEFEELADDYYAVTGNPSCKELPALDISGNCIVDIEDLAIFAGSWLDCLIYPEHECY